MNKTLKKILSVVLTLAMIVTSITVYNTTAKAEEEETPNIEVTASVENNMINAKWSQPDVEFATLAYFINEADNIQLDSAHWAKAANGWCWTQANPTEKRTALDTVAKSNDNSIDVSNGCTYVLTVQYLDAEGNVVASGTSNAVTTEKVVNTNLNLKVERYEKNNIRIIRIRLRFFGRLVFRRRSERHECHQTGADDGDAFGRVALQKLYRAL